MSNQGEASQAEVASLAAAVTRVVEPWESVERTTMFGKPSFRANGTLFAVVSEQGLSLTSLPDDARVVVAEHHRIAPFEANGRLVGSWVTVDIEPNRVGELTDALRASYESAVARKA